MLQTRALRFAYQPEQVFSFPDLDCRNGEHWLLLGQSGCGKSTLLHLVAGLLRPQEGQVMVNGQDLGQLSESALDAFRGKQIGIIFQQSHLIKALNVMDNLLTAQYLAGQAQDRSKVQQLLESLNLGHKLHALPQELSLGEQQRVSIARALVNQPSLVLADEPTSSLDDRNCEEVVKLLLERSAAYGASLLIVTHDARLKALFERQILLG
jgi:putative ABC transport system ATP-binding protein